MPLVEEILRRHVLHQFNVQPGENVGKMTKWADHSMCPIAFGQMTIVARNNKVRELSAMPLFLRPFKFPWAKRLGRSLRGWCHRMRILQSLRSKFKQPHNLKTIYNKIPWLVPTRTNPQPYHPSSKATPNNSPPRTVPGHTTEHHPHTHEVLRKTQQSSEPDFPKRLKSPMCAVFTSHFLNHYPVISFLIPITQHHLAYV